VTTIKNLSVLVGALVLQGCLDSEPNVTVTGEDDLFISNAIDNSNSDGSATTAESTNSNESSTAGDTTAGTSISDELNEELKFTISQASGGAGLDWLKLPMSDDFNAIPHDVSNPITAEKVALGQFLFHDTALATIGQSTESKSWSCASCHHASAGFKSGVPQGIGEGGTNFGFECSQRVLAVGFDGNAAKDAANKPDIQPLTSPSILNTAYQNVMLWNGQFGHAVGDPVNTGIDNAILMTEGTPKAENARRLPGLEIQAVAGLGVHRLNVESNSELQTNPKYQSMFQAAYPNGTNDVKLAAANAIAAYERTVLANQAPFQRWLNGEQSALNSAEKRGGVLFFGKAGCAECHRGPGLSSELGAAENDMFMALGFNDFDQQKQAQVHGPVTDADRAGRGGFTSEEADKFKFKVPQLYNLSDTNVFGHGASFTSLRDVIEYKNLAVSQNPECAADLDTRFKPLNLSVNEMDDLEVFLTTALYDPNLKRYQPASVPSGECIIVDPKTVETHGLCP